MTTKKQQDFNAAGAAAVAAAKVVPPRALERYEVDKLVGIIQPTSITISKSDLAALDTGLDEIEQAANGMFGLKSAILDLTLDRQGGGTYTVVATYAGHDWSVNISMTPESS